MISINEIQATRVSNGEPLVLSVVTDNDLGEDVVLVINKESYSVKMTELTKAIENVRRAQE